jgi:two-component system, sensor histidine kinase YesM
MAGKIDLLKYVKNYHSNSIFFRNLALILLLVTVPLVVLSLFTFQYNKNILDEEITKANTRSLVRFQGSMDIIQNEIERIAAQMINNQDVIRLFNTDMGEYPNYRQIEILQSIMHDMNLMIHGYIYSIYVYSDRNNYLLTQLGGGDLRKWTGQSVYSRLNTPAQDWYLDYQDEGNAKPPKHTNRFLTFYKQFPATETDHRVGTAAILLDIAEVKSFLFGPWTTDREIIFIVDKPGTVLFSTEPDWISKPLGEIFDYSEEDLFVSSSAISIDSVNNRSYIFSYLESGVNDWIYCTVSSREVFFSKQATLRRIMVISLIFSLSVSIGAAFLISLYVFKPIHEVINMLENPRDISDYENYDNELKFIAGNIVHNYDEYQQNRQEIENRVAMLNAARVRALQAQINPHFLNNTLQLVNWTILKETRNEDSEAIDILEALADLVRVNMETKSNLTSLADEAEYVAKYMAIQKRRYGSKIRFDLSIPVETESIPVLKMLIQPIVENAIYHGLKKKSEAGIISLKASRIDEQLIIEVEDNGRGMDIWEMEQLNERLRTADSLPDDHIGLANVSLRLRLVFGPQSGMVLTSRKGGGVRVTVTIPIR